MFKSLMNYIQKLQSLNKEAKKFWLVLLTAASTAVIIVFWLFYLNATVVAVNDLNKPTTWQVFKTGLNVVGEKVELGLANSYIYFTQPKRIEISK